MSGEGNLYIRWHQDGTDDNRTNPGAGVWYLSGALHILNPADPGQDDGMAVTGADQVIRVQVDTTLHTTNVGVQAWVCAFGTAGAPFIPSANGAIGLQRELDDMLNPFTADPAPPAGQLAVDMDWTPLVSDLTGLGLPANADLHVCILANVYSTAGTGDGAKIPPPGPPAIAVATNRHHAQRNIRIHPVTTGMRKAHLQFFAGHPGRRGEERFVLQAGQVRELVLAKPDLERLAAGRWLREDEKLPGKGGRPVAGRGAIREIGLGLGGKLDPRGTIELVLESGRPKALDLEIDVPDGDPGTLHAVDVVQRREGKDAVGGARIVFVHVDEERYEALMKYRRPVAA